MLLLEWSMCHCLAKEFVVCNGDGINFRVHITIACELLGIPGERKVCSGIPRKKFFLDVSWLLIG
jgi:hypothetical protein